MSQLPKKNPPTPKRITARSITLTDAKGKARIHMDAGNGDGYAAISLFGEKGRSIQISTQPNGSVGIELCATDVCASLVFLPDFSSGLFFKDQNGMLGTALGSAFDGEHKLVFFRDGQPSSKSSAPKRTSRKKTG